MKLVLIPPGKFTMGSAASEKDRDDDEVSHEVEITEPFYMGIHEVTIGQWRAFVKDTGYQTEAEKGGAGGYGFNAATRENEGPKPEYTWKYTGWTQTDSHPVVNVTWHDAVAFCQWLSTKEDGERAASAPRVYYRLPTEAEWEYACRAKTTSRFYGGDAKESLKTTANVADGSLTTKWPATHWAEEWDDGYPFTAQVGRFRANAFGLYDMHGNVSEWCQEWYTAYSWAAKRDSLIPNCRVLRGGSWINNSKECRAADRYGDEPGLRYDNTGFRLVRSSH